jgi:hypothetical protein
MVHSALLGASVCSAVWIRLPKRSMPALGCGRTLKRKLCRGGKLSDEIRVQLAREYMQYTIRMGWSDESIHQTRDGVRRKHP